MYRLKLWVGNKTFTTEIERSELEFVEDYIVGRAGNQGVWFDCREDREATRDDPFEVRVKATSIDAYEVL